MQMSKITFKSIDDILGPRELRFFGSGYKRVRQRIHNFEIITLQGDVNAKSVGSVHYPSDWSRKTKDSEIKPHLSSIDALLLAIQFNEHYLNALFNLSDTQRRKMWLRKFIMKAGSVPIEELNNINMSLKHIQTKLSQSSVCSHITVTDILVGNIKIRCEIEHDTEHDTGLSFGNEQTFHPKLNKELSERCLYSNGYKGVENILKEIVIDIDKQQAEAQTFSQYLGGITDNGMSSFYYPTLTVIDCMTTIAQMGQALLYTIDNIHRSETNTLWMRVVSIESDKPQQTLKPFLATTSILKSCLVPMKGKTWRVSDLVGQFHGFHVKYSVAHELPIG